MEYRSFDSFWECLASNHRFLDSLALEHSKASRCSQTSVLFSPAWAAVTTTTIMIITVIIILSCSRLPQDEKEVIGSRTVITRLRCATTVTATTTIIIITITIIVVPAPCSCPC